MTTCIYISDDGNLYALNPSDYRWMPKVEDIEAGVYEPQFEVHPNADGNYDLQVSQTMMPLVRLR